MKKYLYRNLILIGFCAIFAVNVFPQKKAPEVKKTSTATAAATPKFQLSTLENAVFNELNEARTNPQRYVGYLEAQSKAMYGTIIKMPNQPNVRTIEGAPAFDEAVGDLKLVANLSEFKISEGLTGVARAQLADLQENSELGHVGKDGSDLKTRISRFGATIGKAGENICHRGRTAQDVVAIFLVDDGVTSRSHRKAVLSEKFKQVGVACGTGKNAESICVVDFAENFKDKSSEPTTTEY